MNRYKTKAIKEMNIKLKNEWVQNDIIRPYKRVSIQTFWRDYEFLHYGLGHFQYDRKEETTAFR